MRRFLMAPLAVALVGFVGVAGGTQASARHLPVVRWWHPDEFAALAEYGESLGFAHVEAGPLVRSSYHARTGAEAAGEREGRRIPVVAS